MLCPILNFNRKCAVGVGVDVQSPVEDTEGHAECGAVARLMATGEGHPGATPCNVAKQARSPMIVSALITANPRTVGATSARPNGTGPLSRP